MSSYTVLAEVSRKLRTLLWEQFRTDPNIHPAIVPSEAAIVFSNPTETLKNNANRLSLWLYRIEENEFIKNQSPAPVVGGASGKLDLLDAPLALDLNYLVTPVSGNAELDLNLLGKTLQVFYENSITRLHNDDEEVHEHLKIILGRISLEELTRVWEALNEPYRLSVCYRVRVTRVRSRKQVPAAAIRDSARGYGGVPEGERAQR